MRARKEGGKGEEGKGRENEWKKRVLEKTKERQRE